ncbi:hypothetical protein BcepSauron_366 [Burkholderia phage BcepSauron]|uniref:Uncharacterized protein n=2 Tax=Sarumanvirus TaxID=2843450 RepID=A0A482MMJ0_9CAUD|nr:hypothetical protein H1O16_gp363 [Burkholderia phage BcepSaruman]YP_009904744.1 hypothetical protein H1O17_gp366 [Burkholderia phage BcepSauron]QBQ74746.1 hypothetical protein BcepSauron_366 [Burkholderia phage BcepSauron]QBX06776.1 hypothetical protein BcepSaruman_363 [Burkholderia phage BcepSaruman]
MKTKEILNLLLEINRAVARAPDKPLGLGTVETLGRAIEALSKKQKRKFERHVNDWFTREVARMSATKAHRIDGWETLEEYGFEVHGGTDDAPVNDYQELQHAIERETGVKIPLFVLYHTTIEGIIQYIIHGGAQ